MASAQTYESVSATAAAHWNGDADNNGAGDADDASGNGHDGTWVGTATYTDPPPNIPGKAFVFDQTKQINTPYNAALGDFSVVAWCKPAATGMTAYERVVDKDFETGFWLGRNNQTVNFGGGIREASSPFGHYGATTAGQWTHLAMTRSGTTKKVYIDAEEVASVTVSATATDTTTLTIANDNTGITEFLGDIADVMIFTTALSQPQIQALRDGPTSTYESLSVEALLHWPMDEASGSDVADVSGNGRDGTATNSTIVAGKFGNARSFDGSGDFITGPVISTAALPISVCYWVRPNTLTNLAPGVHTNDATSTGGNYSGLSTFYRSTGKLMTQMGDGGNPSPTHRRNYETDASHITTGSWQHVAFVLAAHDEVRFYVNGSLVASSYSSGTTTTMANIGSHPFRVGRRTDGGPFDLDGDVDDVFFFDRDLSQAEVQALHAGPTPTYESLSDDADLLLHYDMDEQSGFQVADTSGNGNNATATNTTIVSGKLGNARDFDGSGDFVTGPTLTTPTFPISLAFWFKIDALPTVTKYPCWTQDSTTTTAVYRGLLIELRTDGKLQTRIGDGTGSGSADRRNYETDAAHITTGTWHHVAFVINDFNDHVFYVDGSLVASSYSSGTATSMNHSGTNRPFRLGRRTQSGPNDFDGSIDDVFFFDRMLTEAEVQALHAGPTTSPPQVIMTLGHVEPQLDTLLKPSYAIVP